MAGKVDSYSVGWSCQKAWKKYVAPDFKSRLANVCYVTDLLNLASLRPNYTNAEDGRCGAAGAAWRVARRRQAPTLANSYILRQPATQLIRPRLKAATLSSST